MEQMAVASTFSCDVLLKASCFCKCVGHFGSNTKFQGRTDHLETRALPGARDAPSTFFIGFFEFGQGHSGPMIPYCPG
ncbi:unnamed protein product, partial [Staurois parvus]